METLYVITVLISSSAAVLAWATKLWWAKEYREAKDQVIRAKDAQIETLKSELNGLHEMTPMKIREYFLSMRQQLEEYNDALNKDLEEAQKEISEKNSVIEQLKSEGSEKQETIKKMEANRDRVIAQLEDLIAKISAADDELMRKKKELQIPMIDTQKLDQMIHSHKNLRNFLTHKVEFDPENYHRFIYNYLEASTAVQESILSDKTAEDDKKVDND